jgi:tetratricopeptide (TPR) repeat protein
MSLDFLSKICTSQPSEPKLALVIHEFFVAPAIRDPFFTATLGIIVLETGVNLYRRQDVLRIFEISSRQLQAWERAELIPHLEQYSFQDLGQLRTLRALRAESVPSASIRESILAMKAVAGMANPLLEARVVRTGTRLAFRHRGAVVDPIRRQLLFDFERSGDERSSFCGPAPLVRPGDAAGRNLQELFHAAVQAEETGDKHKAIALYEEILELDSGYAAACINLGTVFFHMRQYGRAEELYRRATEADPEYVLAYFDLGNVLDELERLEESIASYVKAVTLSPRYADAHYNLALAYERTGENRCALRHWRAYLKLDNRGPWADHARAQIRKLLERENMTIVARAERFIPPRRAGAKLELV